MRPRRAIVAAALPIALLAGCSSGPAPITAHGTLTVDYDSGASDDLSDGDQVVVVNSSGAVVGTGTLHYTGTPKDPIAFPGQPEDGFSFTVTVPGGLQRYGIQCGGTGHGTVWESAAEMKSGPSLNIDETTAGPGGF